MGVKGEAQGMARGTANQGMAVGQTGLNIYVIDGKFENPVESHWLLSNYIRWALKYGCAWGVRVCGGARVSVEGGRMSVGGAGMSVRGDRRL